MASNVVPPEPSAVPPERLTKGDLQKEGSTPADGETSGMSSEKDLEKQSPGATESPSDATRASDEHEYPPTRKAIVIMIGLYPAMFLMALDRTIIATAIPYITDDFNSFGDVGWYGSAYMLTSSAFMLLLGRVYTFYSPKYVFLVLIAIFELGSVVCGAAPTSTAFIVGRAVAGLGAAGMMNGAIVIMVNVVPLVKRPTYTAVFGSLLGIAPIVGPLVGGAFTQKVSWRWCFYINLPIGAITLIIVAFVLKLPGVKTQRKSMKEQISQLDPIGTTFFLPGVICLLLALQWGGSTYAWNSGRIIALLVIFEVCLCVFIAVQVWEGDMVTVPPRITKQRSIAAAVWFSTCVGGTMMIVIYYLPIWFQAIKDATPLHSGIMMLPSLLSLVVASISVGILVKKIGYYVPAFIALSVIMPIGVGLFTTFTPNTGHAKWIGYQVVFGVGLGLGMQQAGLAQQTVLERKDVPTGVTLNFFAQQLGGAIFISIGQNVLVNRLVSSLSGVPNFSPATIVNTGATELRSVVGPQNLELVKKVYSHAITDVCDVALALACLSIVAFLSFEWRSIEAQKGK